MEAVKACICVLVRSVGGGFQKAKGCGILSRDHPSYERGGLAEVFLYFYSLGNYKKPEVRTRSSVLMICHSKDVCSLIFLRVFSRQTGVYSHFMVVAHFVLSSVRAIVTDHVDPAHTV